MKPPEYCPIPMPDGSDCWRPAEPDGYAGICHEHFRTVVKKWFGDPDIQRARCKCGSLAIARDRVARLAVCLECENPVPIDLPDLDTRYLRAHDGDPKYQTQPVRPRTDVVYYVRFGDRIKIGTSTDLPRRLQSLPVDELLAIEPGSFDRESRRHREFAQLLIPGQREWFRIEPSILGHVSALRAKYGPPMAAWRRFVTRTDMTEAA